LSFEVFRFLKVSFVKKKMEEVEAANKAAVESCHGVLNLLSTNQ